MLSSVATATIPAPHRRTSGNPGGACEAPEERGDGARARPASAHRNAHNIDYVKLEARAAGHGSLQQGRQSLWS